MCRIVSGFNNKATTKVLQSIVMDVIFPQAVWTHLGVLTVGEKQLMLRSLKRAGVNS